MDAIRQMKEVVLVDAIASEVESREEISKEIYRSAIPGMGRDLMDSIPEFVSGLGMSWDEELAKLSDAPYEKLIADYDEKMGGKVTVAELIEEFDEIPFLLVMQSIGHGVGLDDEPEIGKFLEKRGIMRRPHVYADRLSYLAHEVASDIVDRAIELEKEQLGSDVEIAESALKAFGNITG